MIKTHSFVGHTSHTVSTLRYANDVDGELIYEKKNKEYLLKTHNSNNLKIEYIILLNISDVNTNFNG